MTRSLILHVGWRKTGSTALQNFIFENSVDQTLQHLVVPAAGRVVQNRTVGARVTAHHGLGGLAFRERSARAWRDLKSFVTSSDCDEFLITSEMFSSHLLRGDGHHDRLARCLSMFDRVRVICWLRRQDEYTVSLAVQAAKHGGTGRERGDSEPKNWPRDADYSLALGKISDVVSRVEITPRLYRGGATDVVAEGIELLGLDPSRLATPSSARINARVSPEMYRAQVEVNRRAKARGVNTGPLQRILISGAGVGGIYAAFTDAAVPFTHDQRQRIIARHEASNLRLCRRYGLDIGFFEPSAAEMAKLPEFNIPDRITRQFSEMLMSGVDATKDANNADAVAFIHTCLAEITTRG
jgi:hypothetical protein